MNAKILGLTIAMAAGAALAAAGPASAEDDTIGGQMFNQTSAPAAIDTCAAVRSDYHTYFSVTFHDVAPTPLVAVEVTNELYDPFGKFLVSVPETFTGLYSTNIAIEDDGLAGAGQKLPIVRTTDDYETAREVVCSISAAKFADGTIWRAQPGRHLPTL